VRIDTGCYGDEGIISDLRHQTAMQGFFVIAQDQGESGISHRHDILALLNDWTWVNDVL
jgi:hypothetical protein